MNAVAKQPTADLAVRIVVLSKNISREREFKGKVYGEQKAGMYNGGDFAKPIKVPVVKGEEYEPGTYVFDPASFTTDEHDNPKLKSVRLLRIGGVEK